MVPRLATRDRVPAPERGATEAPRPAASRRIPGIEGLRAIAASSIVLLHTWEFSSPHGIHTPKALAHGFDALAAGLTLFFTLSGFLLFRPFAAAVARGRPLPSFAGYLRNRALRILPAYWVIFLLTALVLGTTWVRGPTGALTVGRFTDPLKFLAALLLVNGYRPTTLETGIGPAWSLAVEVVFYLVLPLLVLSAYWLARRQRTRRGRTLALVAAPAIVLMIGLAGKAIAAYVLPGPPTAGWTPTWHAVVERGFLGQADLFAFGMFAAIVYVAFQDTGRWVSGRWRWALGGLAVAGWAVCARTMPDGGSQSYLLQNTGEAIAISVLLALVVLPGPPSARPRWSLRVLESWPLVAIGVGSYSLYLWHKPIIDWLRIHGLTFGGWGGMVVNLGIVVAVVGPVTYLTYRFVEAPALRRKRSGTPAGARPAASGVAAPAPGADKVVP